MTHQTKELPLSLTQEQATRFWEKVNLPDSADKCWLWEASVNDMGYGVLTLARVTMYAHRLSWAIRNKRQIPKGLVLDHKCPTGPNPRCVNPAHLEPVQQVTNVRRGKKYLGTDGPCIHGHPANWYVRPSRGGRVCKTCAKEKR